jgi:hypothetical protein
MDLCDNRNVDINDIRPSVLLVKLSSLKQKGRVKVILFEPIAIMQINEARIMEVDAKFTRFTDNIFLIKKIKLYVILLLNQKNRYF